MQHIFKVRFKTLALAAFLQRKHHKSCGVFLSFFHSFVLFSPLISGADPKAQCCLPFSFSWYSELRTAREAKVGPKLK